MALQTACPFPMPVMNPLSSLQSERNVLLQNEPHPAVQSDQRSWLERRILYVVGGLIAIGLIGEYMPWAT